MPAHPFANFDPLSSRLLAEVAGDFFLTLIVLLAVVAGAVVGRWRRHRRSAFGRRLRDGLDADRRRVPALAVAQSGLWALPLLFWAFDASSAVARTTGWIHFPRPAALELLYTSTLALAILILLQSLAVLALAGPGAPRLGVSGGQRVGIRFAIGAVLLDGFLNAWFLPNHW